jgi:histidine phosphotransferase ChpT
MHDTSLAASVASRICHDLVSPVGAVVNGVEMVREMGAAGDAESIGMIGQSAGRASALLQLYRVAFGNAEADAQGFGRGTLAEHAAVLFVPPRMVLDWPERGGPALARREARLLTLLLLCARSTLAMRGSVVLRTGTHAALPLSIDVVAETLSSGAEMLALLEGDDGGAVSPRAVEFVLARDAARELDVRLAVSRTEGRVAISAAPMG